MTLQQIDKKFDELYDFGQDGTYEHKKRLKNLIHQLILSLIEDIGGRLPKEIKIPKSYRFCSVELKKVPICYHDICERMIEKEKGYNSALSEVRATLEKIKSSYKK